MKYIVCFLIISTLNTLVFAQSESQKKIQELERRIDRLERIILKDNKNNVNNSFKIKYEVLCGDPSASILIGFYDRNEKYNGVWGKSNWQYNFETSNSDQMISISATGKDVTVKIYVDGQLQKTATPKGNSDSQAFAQVVLSDK